jgi:hypothetical protein
MDDEKIIEQKFLVLNPLLDKRWCPRAGSGVAPVVGNAA